MMLRFTFVVVALFLIVQFLIIDSTTVVAARCKDGVIVCADSLSAHSGPLIATRQSKKVYLLTDATLVCCVNSAGLGATHFQQLYSELRDTIHEHSHRFDRDLTTCSIVKIARRLIADKYSEAHIVIAGYDKTDSLVDRSGEVDKVKYVLSEVLPGGSRIDQNIVAAGTGSVIISSLLEDHLSSKTKFSAGTLVPCGDEKLTNNLSVQDTAAALRTCIRQASRMDPQTGGDKYSLWVLRPPEAGPTVKEVSTALQ